MRLSFLVCLILYMLFLTTNAQGTPINEEKYIPIGNIEQWITIKGEDILKPVILFLHGGPGSMMSQYDESV